MGVAASERRGSTWRELIEPCRDPANLRRTIKIALVVGTVLTLINQGDVIFGGDATWTTGVKVVLNYCVPFIVSNLGVISGARTVRA